MTTRKPIQPKVTNYDEIARQYTELKEVLDECQRAIKGHNGSSGLVGRLELVEKLLMQEINNLAECVNDILGRITAIEKSLLVSSKAESAKDDPAVVKWPYLLEKFIAPITVGIVVALVLYFAGLK